MGSVAGKAFAGDAGRFGQLERAPGTRRRDAVRLLRSADAEARQRGRGSGAGTPQAGGAPEEVTSGRIRQRRTMRVILTGFNSFHGVDVNPSQLVVEYFARRGEPGIVAEVLPTEYAAAGRRIRSLVREHRPDVVLSLGVAQSRFAMCLERVALNLNDCETPDNAGIVATARPIVAGAPLAYYSSLPLDAMLAALRGVNVPSAITNHAGTFVCNHVYYSAQHEVEQA